MLGKVNLYIARIFDQCSGSGFDSWVGLCYNWDWICDKIIIVNVLCVFTGWALLLLDKLCRVIIINSKCLFLKAHSHEPNFRE